MHAIFFLSELPYPAHYNGLALINYHLIKYAPPDINIEIVINGLDEYTENVNSLMSEFSHISRVHFTNQTFSRANRLLHIFSSAILRTNRFGTISWKSIQIDNAKKPDIVYICPTFAGLNLRSDYPVFLNAVDSIARFNKTRFDKSGQFTDLFKTFIYRQYEKRALQPASVINFVSSEDARYVRSFTSQLPVVTIPNGIDTQCFRPNPSGQFQRTILFTGNFEYYPNIQAARHIASNILPLIRARDNRVTLHIVGKNPPKDLFGVSGVTVSGFVEDISEYYRNAGAFVCALETGSGVKNKVLEAMASGLPVITSKLGVDGIAGVVDGEHYLRADSPDSFAACALRVMDDLALRKSLSTAARIQMEEHHSWEARVSEYYKIMRALANAQIGWKECNRADEI